MFFHNFPPFALAYLYLFEPTPENLIQTDIVHTRTCTNTWNKIPDYLPKFVAKHFNYKFELPFSGVLCLFFELMTKVKHTEIVDN